MSMNNKEVRQLEVVLSEETLLEYGKEQSKELIEIAELEAKKSQISAKIKPKKERVSHLAEAIDTGKEVQPVECEWVYDWPRGSKDLIRQDTAEVVVADEKVLEWERQQHLRGV